MKKPMVGDENQKDCFKSRLGHSWLSLGWNLLAEHANFQRNSRSAPSSKCRGCMEAECKYNTGFANQCGVLSLFKYRHIGVFSHAQRGSCPWLFDGRANRSGRLDSKRERQVRTCGEVEAFYDATVHRIFDTVPTHLWARWRPSLSFN